MTTSFGTRLFAAFIARLRQAIGEERQAIAVFEPDLIFSERCTGKRAKDASSRFESNAFAILTDQ